MTEVKLNIPFQRIKITLPIEELRTELEQYKDMLRDAGEIKQITFDYEKNYMRISFQKK